MNQELMDMAIEAKLNLYVTDRTEKQYIEVIERFAALVAAAEREACAKVLEKMRSDTPMGVHVRRGALFQAIKAIRARGETK